MKATRCPWCGDDPLYVKYHDEEWGVPVHDDRKHFEFLVLESMQAGLSWYIVLRKRENFRKAFAGFDPVQVASFGEEKVEALVQDTGIIRNRAKILAAINNAARFLEVQQEFGSFDRYIWEFSGGAPVVNRWETLADIPASTTLSDTVSRDLKRRGFKFMGTTVVYAHLQATGVVNDHLTDCFRWSEINDLIAHK
jgi:DNA-3-methyladenine glycosylase I